MALSLQHRAQDRRAASSCAHRQLHGGEPSARQGHRRRLRRHRLRHRWQDLGRRVSGRRLCQIYPPWALALCADARRRRRRPPALAHGAELSARCLRATDSRLGSQLPRRDRQADRTRRHHARPRIKTVETSSCGRLFDAVAAMLGLGSEVTFEGQAAIALETAAARARASLDTQPYPFDIDGPTSPDAPMIVDLRPTFAAIATDAAQAVPAEASSV